MADPIISPALRNFFFSAFKRGKPFRNAEKEIGTINTVTIVLSEEKSFMRSNSDLKQVDTPMNAQEREQFLKTFRVPKKVREVTKRYFILIDIKGKQVRIQTTKHDGTKKEFQL